MVLLAAWVGGALLAHSPGCSQEMPSPWSGRSADLYFGSNHASQVSYVHDNNLPDPILLPKRHIYFLDPLLYSNHLFSHASIPPARPPPPMHGSRYLSLLKGDLVPTQGTVGFW